MGRIIILGGGFAGVKCARTLRKKLSSQFEIVLFNKENHMVFHPLLAEVASAAVPMKDVAAPLRQLLTGVRCRTEEVINIDLDKSFIEYEAWDKSRKSMRYDHLVVSCGNTANLALVPGMDDHAFPMKNVGDALRLQAHLIEQMEKAEVCDDPKRKAWYLSVTVIGGGFSGVEVAGELNDFLKLSCKFYSSIREEEINVTLVHAHDQILPEVRPSLREFARKEMEKKGINFVLGVFAKHATAEGVVVGDNQFIHSGTTVCTVGTTPHQIVERLPVEKDRGRVSTANDMGIPGYKNAWAIGDCAAVPNAITGEFCPPTAQYAERQGVQVSSNIVARIEGRSTSDFSYHTKGHLCAIGGHSAVAEIMGCKLSGFAAWFLWRTIYLMKLPSLAQKIKVGIEWGCDLIFPRDLTYVKTDSSRSVGRAFFAPGDYVFKHGDPASDFYVIEQGEVDILVPNPESGQEELVAILGPGDFFGEAALIANRPRNASVRARSNVQSVILGRSLFTEISANLTPLRDAIAKAVRRRRNVWNDLPEIRKILDDIPLEKVVEQIPGGVLRPDDYLDTILDQFTNNKLDFCCVVDQADRMIGVVTKSDLLRTIEAAVNLKEHSDDVIRVHHIMGHNPIVIPKSETTTTAVSMMREHGLKKLPVVADMESERLVGCVRIETIMAEIVHELEKRQQIRVTKEFVNPFAQKRV